MNQPNHQNEPTFLALFVCLADIFDRAQDQMRVLRPCDCEDRARGAVRAAHAALNASCLTSLSAPPRWECINREFGAVVYDGLLENEAMLIATQHGLIARRTS